MPEEIKIRNPKPPSEKDLQILEFLNQGNRISGAKALGLFQTTGIRDIIYRLKCAGYEIHHQDIGYVAKDGKRKVYREWFTIDNKIIPAGVKTENLKKDF